MDGSRQCPRREVTAADVAWISLFQHYQGGHLYRAGGVSEQPALYLTVMRMIDRVVKEAHDG